MINKLLKLIFIAMVFLVSACIKETYDMNKLSEEIKLSPSLGFPAVKGSVTLSDLVDSGDTIVFDQYNFVSIIFTEDSVVNLSWADFYSAKNITGSKGPFTQYATIETQTLDIDTEGIFNNIDGEFLLANPSIKLVYTNSFTFPLKLKLDAVGKRVGDQDESLDLDTFNISLPDIPDQLEISDIFSIDQSNSNLPGLISMLPQKIEFSGTAILDPPLVPDPNSINLEDNRIIGSLEIEVPMEFRMNNLQFKDTLDNFMKVDDDDDDDDSPFNPEDFEMMSIRLSTANGFPIGISVGISLYDSETQTIKSSIDEAAILEPAPVDSNGKAVGVTETTTEIEITQAFFNSVSEADKIIFTFTLNTTSNGTQDVKIYSDYSIDFSAALLLKAQFNIK
jgi:hypothetical protein